MSIYEMRRDLAIRNQKGLSFILASIVLWAGIAVVWLLPIDNILTKNLLTFCCAAPLMPLAFIFSKLIKAEFSANDNPLNKLGIMFSLNQILYLLIAMWAYANAPTAMVMIIAMIFGAHLLPYAWLYISKAYLVMSILIPITILAAGLYLNKEQVFYLPLIMIGFEIILAVWLYTENRIRSGDARNRA